MDQHHEELFGVQPIQDADHQSRIVEVATATDQNSHLPCPWIRNNSIKPRGENARLRAQSPLNSHVILTSLRLSLSAWIEIARKPNRRPSTFNAARKARMASTRGAGRNRTMKTRVGRRLRITRT